MLVSMVSGVTHTEVGRHDLYQHGVVECILPRSEYHFTGDNHSRPCYVLLVQPLGQTGRYLSAWLDMVQLPEVFQSLTMQPLTLPAPTTVVLGPPGCGKTWTLLEMVEQELAAGTEPAKIGYFTFTKRGATEAQDRARVKFGLTRKDLPYFRTLHSMAMRHLALSSGQVMEGARLQEFADWIGERVTGRFSMEEGLASGYERGDRMLFMDGLARVRNVPLREQYRNDPDDIDWAVVERFSRGLADFKKTRSLVDYTDMLQMFVQDGTSPHLDVVFVDEAQDLSALQWEMVRVLCRMARRVVVGGDDDQSIFKWAGADADHLLRLNGSVRVLGQSYRVPRAVQRLAHGVINRVKARRPKEWAPRAAEGAVKWVASIEDVDWRGDSVLFLARNQYLLTPVIRELRSSGVLFEHHGRPSVKQTYLDAIVTWERLRGGQPQTVDDLRKMYQHMEIGVGIKRGFKILPGLQPEASLSFKELQSSGGLLAEPVIWHEALTKIPAEETAYMVRCRRRGERFSQPPRVRIGTIHESKGSEKKHVILATDMAARTHADMFRDPDSEARVFYVGVTRAEETLTIVSPRSTRSYQL